MSEPHRAAATVRAEMARQRIRQITVARHLGLSQQAISRRMSGSIDFTVGELLSIASLLNVPASTLLDGAESAA